MEKIKFGEIQGNVPIAQAVADGAAALAQEEYDSAEENDFCNEPVEVHTIPRWAPKLDTWWPTQALADRGYKLLAGPETSGKSRQDIVVTLGVDAHIDDMHGPLLCYVLHNDGLAFKQGRVKCIPKAGDWFLFDDRVAHSVREAKGRAVFVGWTVPLEALK